MTIYFRYKSTKRPDGTVVKTPSIPILLSENKDSFQIIALLDSGADISVIPKDLAELLGLDLNKKPHKSFGIGGEVESIESGVKITIEKDREKYEFKMPVLVILDEYSFPPLLGRDGFFEEFKITFEQTGQKVWLKKNVDNQF
jgi:hypothetical protein